MHVACIVKYSSSVGPGGGPVRGCTTTCATAFPDPSAPGRLNNSVCVISITHALLWRDVECSSILVHNVSVREHVVVSCGVSVSAIVCIGCFHKRLFVLACYIAIAVDMFRYGLHTSFVGTVVSREHSRIRTSSCLCAMVFLLVSILIQSRVYSVWLTSSICEVCICAQDQGAGGNKMLNCKYACCRHGPAHLAKMPGCGYAHKLSEVALPERIRPQLFKDTTRREKGHAGIDFFVGQQYTPEQLERILTLITNEERASWPVWVRRLVWFLGLRSVGSFAKEGMFEWTTDRDLLAVVLGLPSMTRGYPFEEGLDAYGLTLDQRIAKRRTEESRYVVYIAKESWQDGPQYATETTMHWGATSRQYLGVDAGRGYLRVSIFSDWWYMVEPQHIDVVLELGGWAPSDYFEVSDLAQERIYYEVDQPVSEVQESVYQETESGSSSMLGAGVSGSSCDVEVFTDGSANQGEGIAGSWVFRGQCISDRASLGLRMSGAEIAELLGLVGGLLTVWRCRNQYSSVTIRMDSVNMIKHVFEELTPRDKDGRDLYPAIFVCRLILQRLRGVGIAVRGVYVNRLENVAHRIAKREQEYRLSRDWRAADNRWEAAGIPQSFKAVWEIVAANRMQGKSDYCLPELARLDIERME